MPRRSIGFNTLALVGSRVVAATTSIVVAVAAARDLGPEDFGTFVALIVALFVANTVVTFGTDTLVVRDIATGAHGREVATSIGLQIRLASLIFVVAAAITATGGGSSALLVAALAVIPGVWSTTALAVLRGVERMDRAAMATTAGSCTTVVAALFVAGGDGDILAFVSAVVGGQTVTAVVSTWLARASSTAVWKPTFDSSAWGRAAPFAMMVAASAIAAGCGVLALEIFGGETSTGHYGAANRISEGLRLLPAAVFGAAFPAMNRGVHRDPAYAAAVSKLLVAVGILSAIVIVFAGVIVDVLYVDFEASTSILRILALGLVPLTLRLKWSFELIADGGEALAARLSVIASIITVVLASAATVVGPRSVALATVFGLSCHALLLWRGRVSSFETAT